MSQKFHMSDGEPKPCGAERGNCPLGAGGEEPPHFTGSRKEARAWAEKENEKAHLSSGEHSSIVGGTQSSESTIQTAQDASENTAQTAQTAQSSNPHPEKFVAKNYRTGSPDDPRHSWVPEKHVVVSAVKDETGEEQTFLLHEDELIRDGKLQENLPVKEQPSAVNITEFMERQAVRQEGIRRVNAEAQYGEAVWGRSAVRGMDDEKLRQDLSEPYSDEYSTRPSSVQETLETDGVRGKMIQWDEEKEDVSYLVQRRHKPPMEVSQDVFNALDGVEEYVDEDEYSYGMAMADKHALRREMMDASSGSWSEKRKWVVLDKLKGAEDRSRKYGRDLLEHRRDLENELRRESEEDWNHTKNHNVHWGL